MKMHRLSLGYGSKNLGNGRGFSCVVKGTGGLTRSDPFQLGRLSAGEDTKDNSVILDCPYARRGRRVVGGKMAGANEFPWMVALIIGSKNLCGGSIIADRWILTAAHCVEGKKPFQVGRPLLSLESLKSISLSQPPAVSSFQSGTGATIARVMIALSSIGPTSSSFTQTMSE